MTCLFGGFILKTLDPAHFKSAKEFKDIKGTLENRADKAKLVDGKSSAVHLTQTGSAWIPFSRLPLAVATSCGAKDEVDEVHEVAIVALVMVSPSSDDMRKVEGEM